MPRRRASKVSKAISASSSAENGPPVSTRKSSKATWPPLATPSALTKAFHFSSSAHSEATVSSTENATFEAQR